MGCLANGGSCLEPGDTSFTVDIGELPAGREVAISYHVQIDEDLQEGVMSVENQGVVNNVGDITPYPDEAETASPPGGDAVHCPQIFTNNPTTRALGDPTVTQLDEDPTAEDLRHSPAHPVPSSCRSSIGMRSREMPGA